jgi:LysR family transcriptional regulator, benzoate and cis,cis-muconate-responsive activator of ben and cat genes
VSVHPEITPPSNFHHFRHTTAVSRAGQSFYIDNAHLMGRYLDTTENARHVAEGKAGLLRGAYMAFAATE